MGVLSIVHAVQTSNSHGCWVLGWLLTFYDKKGDEVKGVQGDGGREAGAKKGKEFPPKK